MLIAGLVLAGAFGAVMRYVVDAFVEDRVPGRFPWGTVTVNVSGSLVLGVLTGLAMYHGLGDLPRVVIGTGFCGAYTTFSTFSYETVRLIEEGAVGAAAGNALGSVALGLAAAALGLSVTAVI